MGSDKRNAWLQKLDQECPYQVVLRRRPLDEEIEILDFLCSLEGRFDMYVEDDYAVFVRYCFEIPHDAAIFRGRFQSGNDHRLKLVG